MVRLGMSKTIHEKQTERAMAIYLRCYELGYDADMIRDEIVFYLGVSRGQAIEWIEFFEGYVNQ